MTIAPAGSPENFSLTGKLALVTGASRGLGEGCALALARAGADVVLAARDRDSLTVVADKIKELGRIAHIMVVDVTNLEAFAAAVDGFPTIDIFINNAGTNCPQPFLDVDVDTYDEVTNLNVRAAFFAAQAVAKKMVREKIEGTIIHMSSQAGHRALRDRSVYCSSKFAIEGLTKTMAFELAEHNIRVNAVAPTFVETPMTRPSLDNKDFRDYVEGKIKLPRLGQVEDVASAVVFLASPAASMITGSSLLVDGGWTIH